MNIIIENPDIHKFDKPDFGTVRATLVEDSAFVCRSDLAKSILGAQDKQTSYRVFHNDTAICEYVSVKLGKGNPTIFLKAQDIVANLDKATGKGKSAKSSERRTIVKQWLIDEIIPSIEPVTSKESLAVTIIEPSNQNVLPAVISADNVSVVPTGMINDVRAYIDENGTAWINAEDAARGLGFTQIAASGNLVVRWERVNNYLKSFGFIPTNGDVVQADDFIPENIFYRLAMKANNDAAERFQAYIADEIFPALRKTGFYAVGGKDPIDQMINNPDNWIKLLQAHSETKKQNKELQETVAIMTPKAQVYDAIVADDKLVSFRDTATMLRDVHGIKVTERYLERLCLKHKWTYINKDGEYKIYKLIGFDGGFMKYKNCRWNNGHYGPCKHFTPKGIQQLIEWLKPESSLF